MKRPETVQTEKHEKPKMKKTAVLSRLLPYLMRYKFLMLGAILLTVGGNLLSLAGPYISGLAVDAMELGRGKVNFEKVGCYGVLMVVMYAISAALSYALTRLMIVISRRVVNTMRHDVFQQLSELPVGYFDTHQTGDILSRISYDIDTINTSLTNDMVRVFARAVTVIGALIMTHSDDNGLVLPPKLAPIQVVIVPITKNAEQLQAISEKLAPVISQLRAAGISVKYDDADNKRPGFKFADYELKGVPVRLVMGGRDLEENTIEIMRRDTLEKETRSFDGIVEYVEQLLEDIQANIYKKALDFRNAHIYECDNYEEFKERIKDGGFFLCHWDGTAETEAKIKEETQATIRCVPFMFEQTPGVDMVSGKPATQRVIIARSY